jgi:hypothetical protein
MDKTTHENAGNKRPGTTEYTQISLSKMLIDAADPPSGAEPGGGR